jgi:hypothetical protein
MAEQRMRYNDDTRRNAVSQARELIETQNYSQTQACLAVAEDLGLKSPRTIAIWAVDLNQPLPSGADAQAKALKAHMANRVYGTQARLDLSDAAFRKAEQVLQAIVEPGDLWKWTTAFTNLVESRRLEEGKANSRLGIELPTQRSDEPRDLAELATGRVIEQKALPENVSPLARRQA